MVLCRAHMEKSRQKIRGIIVNSGNANCCSGPEGYAASVATANRLAQELGRVDPSQILVCSTGVIGAPLQVDKILVAVPDLVRSRESGSRVLRAIRARDHDHGHGSEMGGREIPHRRQTGAHRRLRKGFWHDPSKHGHNVCVS